MGGKMARWRHVAALFIVGGLLAAGCGDDGKTTSAPATTGAVSVATTGASGPTTTAPLAPKSIRFTLATQVWSTDTSVYSSLPIALGYWKAENLEVKLDGVAGGGAAVQLIQGGTTDVTISGPDSSDWIPRSRGLDMQAFYNLVPKYFSYIGVPDDSPIKTYADLKGKSIGVSSLAQGSIAMTKAAIKQAGLDPEKDVKFVAIGTGAQAATALTTKKDVDVWGLWDAQYSIMENATGVKVRPIRADIEKTVDFAIPMSGRASKIKEDPEPYIRLARGILKATIYALANPECAVKIHYETRPETKPQGVTDEVALAQGVKVLKDRLANMDIRDLPGYPTRKWGETPAAGAQAYFDLIMKGSASLGAEKFEVTDTYTNALIGSINNIDFKQIEADAKACKR